MEERSVGGWSRKRILFHGMNTGLCWKFREGKDKGMPYKFSWRSSRKMLGLWVYRIWHWAS